ncbi:hypothetical protein [Algibacter pectinivorans]|uniref:Uncharacterized protein n=1 Tax=Algibacter pectinivorans TaxID=870482 RepID=A0A1I1S5C5_9FLAO|nr:hypothetical protein [Algibacter pectinivorans]SFD41725.1 hypothetical protein SAMN04487987_11328 [Algibacter pectinivorans]
MNKKEERIRLIQECALVRDLLLSVDKIIKINNIPIDLDWKATYNDPKLYYLFEHCGGMFIKEDDD